MIKVRASDWVLVFPKAIHSIELNVGIEIYKEMYSLNTVRFEM